MDNIEILEELKQIHTQLKTLQYRTMSLMEKLENEQIIKANGYKEQQKEIIDKYIETNGYMLDKTKQADLYNLLRQLNINRLTLYKILVSLNYKFKYHDDGKEWKTLEIIK